MFGNKSKPDPARLRAFEAAREATRRAAFLHKAERTDGDEKAQLDRALLFRVCRASALATGQAIGKSETEVDADISALCDADIARLKKGSEKKLQEFGQESHQIAKAYLASVDPEALAAWTQGVQSARN